MKIFLDFETRSEVSVEDVGAWVYSLHPSTEILCLAYKIDDGATVSWCPFSYDIEKNNGDSVDDLAPLFSAIANGGEIHAHNSFFEFCIWNNVGTRIGFPKAALSKFFCSAAKAATHALPRSLEDVGRVLKAEIQKDKEGKRLMQKMSQPRKATKYDDSRWHDSPYDFERLMQYCVTDVDAEKSFEELLPEMSEKEKQVFLLDQLINLRGIGCDIELVEKAQEFVTEYAAKKIDDLSRITNGAITTPNQRDRIVTFLARRGVELSGLTAEEVTRLLDLDTLDAESRDVLEIRRDLSKSSTKKLSAMIDTCDFQRRIRGTLLYHGAGPGRWTGKLIQPQNFVRGVENPEEILGDLREMDYETFTLFYPNVIATISSALRGFLVAGEGKRFYAGDFSAIECRAVKWLSGHEKGLEEYRQGIDSYKAMASEIYRTPISKITKKERQLGKQAELGCGYGMGAEKFLATCHADGKKYKSDVLLSVDEDMAKTAVAAYRMRNKPVVEFWKKLETAAKAAIKFKGKVFQAGPIYYCFVGQFLYTKLPSGRKIAYHNPRLLMKNSNFGPREQVAYDALKNGVWGLQFTWGGKLCENVTQGIARDFMVNAMFELEREKYPIVFTVHDEVICETPENFGSVEEFESIMKRLPSWGKTCPINAEAWTGFRYKK